MLLEHVPRNDLPSQIRILERYKRLDAAKTDGEEGGKNVCRSRPQFVDGFARAEAVGWAEQEARHPSCNLGRAERPLGLEVGAVEKK